MRFLVVVALCSMVLNTIEVAGALVCSDNEVLNPCPGPCVPGEISYCYEWIKNVPNDCDPTVIPPCDERCDCKAGFVRNDKGLCVEKENCCADPNAIVVDSPEVCPNTCVRVQTGKVECDDKCYFRGCVCKPGFIFNKFMGFCMDEKKCVKCKKNEVFNPCPKYCTFDEDCGSYVDGFIKDCPQQPDDWVCEPRCECAKGYVRIAGKCQRPDKCCNDPFAKVVSCPAPCEATCTYTPPPGCKINCSKRKCHCMKGYVKDAFGKCILKSKCPPPKVNKVCKGTHKVWKDCGSSCPPTCENRSPACIPMCVPGCFCKEGYYLNNANECVTAHGCNHHHHH